MKRPPLIHICLLIAFIFNSLGPFPIAQADEFLLPAPGVMVPLSTPLNPPILKGLKVHPENPFLFDFILDQGDALSRMSSPNALIGDPHQEQLKQQATKLIKYFLASLTIPENDLWVNLSPYEKNRIIPSSFGLTEMGRDLLAEDYMLKQITASLIYPENSIGKKFWKRVYEEAAKKFGTTNISVNTFNKVWIVPDKAVVYENAKAGTAYVVESKLKVMLEQDYLALEKNISVKNIVILSEAKDLNKINYIRDSSASPQNDINALGSQIIREIVIPELTREVNEGKNFAQLRQVYNSLILATWYKKKIKDSILEQVYADRNKINGVEYNSTVIPKPSAVIPAKANPHIGHSRELEIQNRINSDMDPRLREDDVKKNDVELIYQRYLQAFKKGAFNYIKEDSTFPPIGGDGLRGGLIPRKYFSGGAVLNVDKAMLIIDVLRHLPRTKLLTFMRVIMHPIKQTPLVKHIVSEVKKHRGSSAGVYTMTIDDDRDGKAALEEFIHLRMNAKPSDDQEALRQKFVELRKKFFPWVLKRLDRLKNQKRPLRILVTVHVRGVAREYGGLALLMRGLLSMHKNIQFRVSTTAYENFSQRGNHTMNVKEIPHARFGQSEEFNDYPADIVLGVYDDKANRRERSLLIMADGKVHGQVEYRGTLNENNYAGPLGTIILDPTLRQMREASDHKDDPQLRMRRRQQWLNRNMTAAERSALPNAVEGIWTFSHNTQLTSEVELLVNMLGNSRTKNFFRKYCFAGDKQQIVIFSSNVSHFYYGKNLGSLGVTIIEDGQVVHQGHLPITIVVKDLPNISVRELIGFHTGTMKRSRGDKFWVDFPLFVTSPTSWKEAVSTGALWRNSNGMYIEDDGIKSLIARKVMEDLNHSRDQLTPDEIEKITAGIAKRFMSGSNENFYENLEYWTLWAKRFSSLMYEQYNQLVDILGIAVYNADASMAHKTLSETQESPSQLIKRMKEMLRKTRIQAKIYDRKENKWVPITIRLLRKQDFRQVLLHFKEINKPDWFRVPDYIVLVAESARGIEGFEVVSIPSANNMLEGYEYAGKIRMNYPIVQVPLIMTRHDEEIRKGVPRIRGVGSILMAAVASLARDIAVPQSLDQSRVLLQSGITAQGDYGSPDNFYLKIGMKPLDPGFQELRALHKGDLVARSRYVNEFAWSPRSMTAHLQRVQQEFKLKFLGDGMMKSATDHAMDAYAFNHLDPVLENIARREGLFLDFNGSGAPADMKRYQGESKLMPLIGENGQELVRYDFHKISSDGLEYSLVASQVGSLIFLTEEFYNTLEAGEKAKLKDKVIRYPENNYIWRWHNYTTAMIFALMKSNLKGRHVIDSGAGNGCLAIVALKLGASFVHLVDFNSSELKEAKEIMGLNGFNEGERMDFKLYRGDLRSSNFTNQVGKEAGEMARKNKKRLILISNIGYWGDREWASNASSLRIAKAAGDVISSVYLGGYDYRNPEHNRNVWSYDRDNLLEMSMRTHSDVWTNYRPSLPLVQIGEVQRAPRSEKRLTAGVISDRQMAAVAPDKAMQGVIIKTDLSGSRLSLKDPIPLDQSGDITLKELSVSKDQKIWSGVFINRKYKVRNPKGKVIRIERREYKIQAQIERTPIIKFQARDFKTGRVVWMEQDLNRLKAYENDTSAFGNFRRMKTGAEKIVGSEFGFSVFIQNGRTLSLIGKDDASVEVKEHLIKSGYIYVNGERGEGYATMIRALEKVYFMTEGFSGFDIEAGFAVTRGELKPNASKSKAAFDRLFYGKPMPYKDLMSDREYSYFRSHVGGDERTGKFLAQMARALPKFDVSASIRLFNIKYSRYEHNYFNLEIARRLFAIGRELGLEYINNNYDFRGYIHAHGDKAVPLSGRGEMRIQDGVLIIRHPSFKGFDHVGRDRQVVYASSEPKVAQMLRELQLLNGFFRQDTQALRVLGNYPVLMASIKAGHINVAPGSLGKSIQEWANGLLKYDLDDEPDLDDIGLGDSIIDELRQLAFDLHQQGLKAGAAARGKVYKIIRKKVAKIKADDITSDDFDWTIVGTKDLSDHATVATPSGGIDLTAGKMKVEVKSEIASSLARNDSLEGIKFHLDAAMLARLQNATGFVPVIINRHPLKSLSEFLGLNQ